MELRDVLHKLEKTWTIPFEFCIINKNRETHFKILHRYYPTNEKIAKFTDIDSKCSFCSLTTDKTFVIFFFLVQ